MATDRSLTTLLRALQSGPDKQDISRLLSSAAGLLTLLSNPFNVTLLTSQLLSAPAIWQHPDGLETPIRILSIFNSASARVRSENELQSANERSPVSSTLTEDEWVTAVIKGVDERSLRWRHVLVFGGLMLGLSTPNSHQLSADLLWTVQKSLVKAANYAVQGSETESGLAGKSIAVTLSHVFDLLGDIQKSNLDHVLLLPVFSRAPFFDEEGLHSGYFLSMMDADVIETSPGKFDWSSRSSTFARVQSMASGPIVASLGPLSQLVAFSANSVQDSNLLAVLVEDLSAFSRSLCVQWRQNKLSEVDITEEATFLSEEALKDTLPPLWRVLRSSMFAIVVILRSVLGRVLGDPRVPISIAPFIAIQALHILRNLYFISTRLGAGAFSQYNFVYLTAIDILSRYPVQAEAFLREIQTSETDYIPPHPVDRCFDLYFLNTAEHFASVLDPQTNENLLMRAAKPYLGLGGDHRLVEVFEAAHSVMLAVFSAPQNAAIVSRDLDSYFTTLSQVFPHCISPRQFRMAVTSLIRVITPPSPVSEVNPLLPSTLLEMIHFRLAYASTEPLLFANTEPVSRLEGDEQRMISEQAVLVLTLIDALPFLPLLELEEWLPVVAQSIQYVQDERILQACRQRFWEVLISGEMDVDRSAICVSWWTSRGGKGIVLNSDISNGDDGPLMSGGLGEAGKL